MILNANEEYWDWPLQDNDGIVKVTNTSEKFDVALEAKSFLPNEIQVRVIGSLLEIHFEHVQKKGDPYVYRVITRSYRLPADIDIRTLKSHLSSKGKLHISAKKL
ncbi:unnamed protein product, partial [Mesorhabditis belari]|uniref:SHSP domain-containing protein n=1 Tax=Mesorhabditis belari TaxID=2138241 RepID=A0AAF3EZG7_9BILA